MSLRKHITLNTLYTLVNGMTGHVCSRFNLENFPSLGLISEVDTMSDGKFSQALKADDIPIF